MFSNIKLSTREGNQERERERERKRERERERERERDRQTHKHRHRDTKRERQTKRVCLSVFQAHTLPKKEKKVDPVTVSICVFATSLFRTVLQLVYCHPIIRILFQPRSQSTVRPAGGREQN